MKLGLTFNDVLLVPQRSPLSSRSEAEVKTIFTKNISLNIPLVSANMATVTEHKMAIALAREGGLGVIHQFGSIQQQAEEVRKVKKSTSYIIENPLSVPPLTTIKQAAEIMKKEGVTSLLVMRGDELIGIFTSRDYLFEENQERLITEVMTSKEHLVTAPSGIPLEEAKKLLHAHRIEKLPLLENGKVRGLMTTQDIKKLECWPQACRDEKGRLRVGAAVGVKDALLRAQALVEAGVDVLILDIAHAHSDLAIQRIKELKKYFSIDVMAGNIATASAARDLIEAGADGLKVGIGPSPVCLEGDTPILMSDYTVKKVKEIKVGDQVITHKGRVRMVTKTYKRPYSGKFISVKVRGCPSRLVMTEEHPVFATVFEAKYDKIAKYGPKYYFSKAKHNTGLKWVRANQLKKFDLMVLPKIKQKKMVKTIFDLAKIFPRYNFDSQKIWSHKIGFNPNEESYNDLAERFRTTPRIIGNVVLGKNSINKGLNNKVNSYLKSISYQRKISPIKINRFIELNEDFARLMGYYLAEGSMGGNKNNRQVGFCFHQNETAYHHDIKYLVERVFGYSGTGIVYDKKDKAATVYIYNNLIAKFFETLIPGNALTKIIPKGILDSDEGVLKEVLVGAIRGDGTIKDYRRVKYKTSSISLAFQVSQILNILGYFSTITKVKPSKKSKNYSYIVNLSGKQYERFSLEMQKLNIKITPVNISKQQIWDDKNYIYLAVENVKEFDKEMEVYNIEVDEDNSYIANRVVTHNCTTRVVSGAGVPQLTAIMDVVAVAKQYNIPVCADGGMKYPGDVTKALAAGASSIFSGQLFAGTDESPGLIILKDGKRYKKYMGSASYDSNHERKELQEGKEFKERLDVFIEGVATLVDYKGAVHDVIRSLLKGVQSGISYCGANTLQEMQQKAEFIQITSAGWTESGSLGEKLSE